MTTLIDRNETEELVFTDGKTVMLFPRGWAQAFPDEMAEEIFDDEGVEGSLYGYYSESGDDNNWTVNYQPVLTIREGLEQGAWREVGMDEAGSICPGLTRYLNQLNQQ